MSVTLVIGGARSGKSTFAEKLAQTKSEQFALPVLYLATGQASDQEMAGRISRHRTQRPAAWQTIEEPLAIDQVIRQQTNAGQVLLIDCLSLLVNNWMFFSADPLLESDFHQRSDTLIAAMQSASYPIIAVTNEVGAGIVPGDPLSRQYRDYLGWLNQAVAAICEQVYLVTAGIAIELKEREVQL